MCLPVRSTTPLTLALILATCVGSASAQLQWQQTGVQQANHRQVAAPRPATPVRQRAKAPTQVAPTTQGPRSVASRIASADARRTGSQATSVLRNASLAVPRVDTAVVPACHSCGGGLGNCGCGVPQVEATCGIPDCSVGGCGDPGCGVPESGSCGCGEVGCGGACGYNCGCGDVCQCGSRPTGLGCKERGAVPLVLYVPPIHELTFFGGVQAFKGALDRNRDRGNFGFHEGVNAGGRMAWLPFPQLGYQLGYQATHSQLHGTVSPASTVSHTQQFFTAGLFHRKPVGLQYGMVYDLLQDERQTTTDFGQVRGLVSITNPGGHEFGFTFASHMNEEVINNATYQGVNQYLFFYRAHGCQGGEFRLFGGADDKSNGILGGDVDIPMNDRWSMQSGFSYLLPQDDAAGVGGAEEAWNLGMNLVWHYGKRAKRSYKSPFRPMFNVADNGSFFVDDRP